MIVLALDTATDRPTIAVGTREQPGDDLAVPHRHDLSRDIDRLVAELLSARNLSPAALGGVLVADGPGSFTGLRIGVAFAKGLCRARGLPLFTAPSMLGAAWSACTSARQHAWPPVMVEYDALRGDVYRAVYRFGDGRVEALEQPALARQNSATPAGVTRAAERSASASALLALLGSPGGPAQVGDPASWEPAYGRPAEAEARRLARDAHR